MASTQTGLAVPPLTDTIIAAVSRMVYDGGTREPSHSQIDEQFQRAGLTAADPNLTPPPKGKAKRVRGVLQWAIENDVAKGQRLVHYIIALVRGVGGFRQGPNFIGQDVIVDLQSAFASEGFLLTETGELTPTVLDGLNGQQMTDALWVYVRRAQKGVTDAALITGTGKDLLEAVAAHVVNQRYGNYAYSNNFPTLLGQAFAAVGLCPKEKPTMTPQEEMEVALHRLACAANRLRNKQGTGHGRPFPAQVTAAEAKAAVQSMGVVAARLLDAL